MDTSRKLLATRGLKRKKNRVNPGFYKSTEMIWRGKNWRTKVLKEGNPSRNIHLLSITLHFPLNIQHQQTPDPVFLKGSIQK